MVMDTVVIRGGGDIATGVAYRLYKSGFNIIILDIPKPMAIRRTVSFCQAIYDGEMTVEGVKAVLCHGVNSALMEIKRGNIPVIIDEHGDMIKEIKPLAVVDCILAKKNMGTHKSMAPITIGVGPGFVAGKDVDVVVESNRGHNLGRLIYKGAAAKNTGIPGDIMGYSGERIIRAVETGTVAWNCKIGDLVCTGDILGNIGETHITANLSGVVRGLIMDGIYVHKGLKIGDIDPRGEFINATTISDKARAIGGGVLEAVMHFKSQWTIENKKTGNS